MQCNEREKLQNLSSWGDNDAVEDVARMVYQYSIVGHGLGDFLNCLILGFRNRSRILINSIFKTLDYKLEVLEL